MIDEDSKIVIVELSKNIENMKCCGNCLNAFQEDCPVREGGQSNAFCGYWQSDNLTRERRIWHKVE